MNNILVEKLERAIMLMETAWMDEEPYPCEVAARDELKACVELVKTNAVNDNWDILTPGMKLTVWVEYLWKRYITGKL